MRENNFNKGRYNAHGLKTEAEHDCLTLKTKLRQYYLDKYHNQQGSLFEAYYGYGLLYQSVYSKYIFDAHYKCDKVIASPDCYKGSCESYIQQTDLSHVSVADFDHHGLPFDAIRLFFKKNVPDSCTVFLTFGVQGFQRKAIIKKSSVVYHGDDTKIQLSWSLLPVLPSKFLKDMCEDLGYEIIEITKLQYKSLVCYYGLHIKRRTDRANQSIRYNP